MLRRGKIWNECFNKVDMRGQTRPDVVNSLVLMRFVFPWHMNNANASPGASTRKGKILILVLMLA